MVAPAVSPAIIGRAAELDELRGALDDARHGGSVTVVVGGEAGAGKTRLVSEFTDATHDVTVLTGQCVELGSDGVAYAPIIGVLRSVVAEYGQEHVVEWAGSGADALASLLPALDLPDAPTEPGRGRMFEVVTTVLERAASQQPLVVVLEDLQWADGSTRDLLRFAIRALADTPVLLVLTYRTDEMVRTHPLRSLLAELDRVRSVRRLSVPRLTQLEVAAQLESIWGDTAAPDILDRVFRRSEGLPFFVEELAGAERDGHSTGLSDSLRDLLLVRVEQLSAATQRLLRLVSVGGNRVDHELLTQVSADSAGELEEQVREAVSSNVLSVDGSGYAFRHALLREALQDDMLPGERVRFHHQYADALTGAGGSAAMEAAYHLFEAREYDGAFRAYLAAAEHAVGAYAYREGQFAYERVLELWDSVDAPDGVAEAHRAEILTRAASAAARAGELERALSLGEAALSEPESDTDVATRTELTVQRFRILADLGRPTSEDEIHATLDALPDERLHTDRMRLLAALSTRRVMASDYEGTVRAAREAARIAAEFDDTDTRVKALTHLASGRIHLGDVDGGLEVLEQARTIATTYAGSSLSYHANASDVLCQLGWYEQAARVAQSGIDAAHRIGRSRTLGALLVGNAAEPLVALGEWDEAERMVERTLEFEPVIRHEWQLRRIQATLRLWRGDPEAAARGFDEMRDVILRRFADPQYAIPAARIAAEIELGRGDAAAAWTYIDSHLDTALRSQGYDLPLLATGALALGALASAGDERPTAVTRIRCELDRIGEWGPAASWRALVDAELCGETDDAPRAWESAVAAPQLPAHLVAYARYRLAAAQLASGDRSTSADSVRLATTAAEDLGAGLILRWIGDLSRRGRLAAAQPAADRQQLTPRELDVLRLIAAGRSNRQIGEELFISAKTASVHVSNILAKLDVAGRGEAAAAARDLLDTTGRGAARHPPTAGPPLRP